MRGIARGDLAGYEEWLRQRRLAAAHQVGHFSRWVDRFLHLRASRPRESWQDTLTVFLEDLGDGQYEPWQVRQAGDAVTLYCGQFCEGRDTHAAPKRPTRDEGGARGKGSRRGSGEEWRAEDGVGREDRGRPGSRSSKASPVQPAKPELEGGVPAEGGGVRSHVEMLAKMRRLLRLRHYATCTERCYLSWNRRFLRYVGRSGEHEPAGEDVQAFLSHLAVSTICRCARSACRPPGRAQRRG